MSQSFLCNSTDTVVETTKGRLRGFKFNDIYTFLGVKYADAKRFQMPEEVAPWEGIKDAMSYGFVCPLMDKAVPLGEVMVPHQYWPENENCQYLNIWTPAINENKKKPVMVWLHGGGFEAGSSIEQVAYHGENMAAFGDVVVVTINHRLNVLGYLDLEPFGEKYKNSGNSGQADIVAALQWVQDNIAGFGGDPDNVTIYGQSGGGMKVIALMQTPSADGLFHKGIVQSGLIDGFLGPKDASGTLVVKAILKELDIEEENIEALETIDYDTLVTAYKAVAGELRSKGHYVGGAPIVNDFYLGDPKDVGLRDHAKTIPLMVGSTIAEFAFGPGLLNKQEMSDDVVHSMVKEKYGERYEELMNLYGEAYPDKHVVDVLDIDSIFRSPTIRFINQKAAFSESPTYAYMFTFEFPIESGKGAWHCSEIPFVFHNIDKVPICNVEGVSKALEEKMSRAWTNFAHTGNPNADGLPEWEVCTADREVTMIFDKICQTKVNYDHELVALHKEIAPPFIFRKDEIQH